MLPDRPPAPRYYDLLMAGFVTVLICSNFIGPGKVVGLDLWLLGHVQFGAGNIFFPISYIFGDVLTEVYGYARARRVIWAGFAAMLFAAVMAYGVMWLPPSAAEPFNQKFQPALELVFGASGRIVLGSIVAFWAGDFANSYVLARLKVLTGGRHLWTRTIGSTIVGQGIDSFVFYPIAFAGKWSGETMIAVIVTNWAIKVGVEAAMTPATYWACSRLKRAEGLDHFDRGTDFNPFSLRT